MEDKTIIDFIKSLEKSKLIKSGSHKRSEVISQVKEVVSLTDDEVKSLNNPAITFFHTEFSDWIETYA